MRRAETMAPSEKSKLLILKLGGSVITDKSRDFAPRINVIKRLALEIAESKYPLVVVHGGGSFGHPLAAKYRLFEGLRSRKQLLGFALTHQAMVDLNSIVVEALMAAKVPAVPVQPSACFLVSGGKILSAELSVIKKMIEIGLTPVLYGDVVPDLATGASILSGDEISTYLAKKLGAQRIIFGADVDGVYTEDPKRGGAPVLLRKISRDDWSRISFSRDRRVKDVTGGMRRKVEELLKLAKFGIEAEIANANRPGVIRRLLKGEKGIGTIIKVRLNGKQD
ncbi:MAG: isopentenyl phosphate kinase [Candidatus Hadarchaeales archaeon]